MDDGLTELLHERFDAFMAGLDAPVYVVTTQAADGERAGCLVGFATQCSIEPRRLLVGISVLNHTFGVVARAEVVAVHVVPPAATGVAELFAAETGDEIDKFSRTSWRPGPHGVPVLDDCPSWVVGRITHRVPELGDHLGLVLEPVAASGVAPTGDELTLATARSFSAGHPG